METKLQMRAGGGGGGACNPYETDMDDMLRETPNAKDLQALDWVGHKVPKRG